MKAEPRSKRVTVLKVYLPGILQLLTENLYANPAVAVRECIQNAYDAIARRWMREQDFEPRISITVDADSRTLTFRDNGAGLTRDEIETYLATVGQSLTRHLQEKQGETPYPMIGQFGLGLLSAFMVAERIEVTTRSYMSGEAWQWVNESDGGTTLTPLAGHPVGTAVRLHLHADGAFLLNPGVVGSLVRLYADLLPVPITLGGEVLNLMHAPWHGASADEGTYRTYLSHYVEDEPLLVVPFSAPADFAYHVRGVLFFPANAMLSINEFGNARVFVRRMLVDRDEKTLLPEWARFASAFVESDDFKLTASRDTIMHDDAYHAIKGVIERRLLGFLTELAREQPAVWRTVVEEYNDLLIGWALESHHLFDTVANHAAFSTNLGPMRLGEVVQQAGAITYSADENVTRSLRIVTSLTGTPVVDASRFVAEAFIKRYGDLHDVAVVRLDDVPDALFEAVDAPEWEPLRLYFEQQGYTARVAAFEPHDLPAVLIVPTPDEEVLHLRQAADDEATYNETLRFFFKEYLRRYDLSGVHPTIILNTENRLLQRLIGLSPESERFGAAAEIILQSANLWARGLDTVEEMKAAYSVISYSLERLLT